jgi:hypothetical protein
MAKFTVRIELHNAETNDYIKLWEAMEKEDFTDIICSSTKKYKMPNGEYDIQGDYTTKDILSKSKKAIASTTVKGSVLVTKVEERIWSNIEEI